MVPKFLRVDERVFHAGTTSRFLLLVTLLLLSSGSMMAVVVGGMTHMPGSAKASDEAVKSERPQLYLVLEIR